MTLHTPTMTMRVLGDENLLAIIMEKIDNPQTLFNLTLVLPDAKETFERCPKQLLTAVLSHQPSEIQLLATLFIALKHDHVTRDSMVLLLWGYLRLEDTAGLVEPPDAAVDLTIPQELSNPFETLRKLAATWIAVEDLASDYVERSMEFIQECKDTEAAGLATVRYRCGYPVRPLSHLWSRELLTYLPYRNWDKPQPWSLPLSTSELHRVKRALWRLEIIAAVSHEPHSFPNEGGTDSEPADVYRGDFIGMVALPKDHDEGTRMLLASFPTSELAQLESIYDYLSWATIGKVYQQKIDPDLPDDDEVVERARADRWVRMSPLEQSQYDHADFRADFPTETDVQRARDHGRHLTYLMSLGLSFLHRVKRQISRDQGKIIPGNYPPLRYRSRAGLRDTWYSMNAYRHDPIMNLYYLKLKYTKDGNSVTPKPAFYTNGVLVPPAYGSRYVQTRVFGDFEQQELWLAGCHMWDKRE